MEFFITQPMDGFKREQIDTLLEHPSAKKIIPSSVTIPVYEAEITYFTQYGNYKSKIIYLIGGWESYDEEYVDFFTDDLVDRIKQAGKSGWTDIEPGYINKIGNLVFDGSAEALTSIDKRLLYYCSDDCNGKLVEKLRRTHPMNIFTDAINIPLYEITYQYETVRGQQCVNTKYVLHRDGMIDDVFARWKDFFNNKYPFKAVLNAEILDTARIGTCRVA